MRSAATERQSRLCDTASAQFQQDGYAVIEGLLCDTDLQPVIDEIQHEVNTRARQLVRDGKLSQTFEERGFERQLTLISRETETRSCWTWPRRCAGPS